MVEHLTLVFERLDISADVREATNAAVTLSLNKVKELILRKKNTKVASKSKDVNGYIHWKMRKSPDSDMKVHRLTKALKTKEQLEQKLKTVTEVITDLEAELPEKGKVRTKDERLLDNAVEEKRRKEAAEFAKRLGQQQAEAAKRRKLKEAAIIQEKERTWDREERDRSLSDEQRKECRQQRLIELQSRSRKRREELEVRRRIASQEDKRLKRIKYMHEKLTDEFQTRVLQPIEEERRLVLSQKKRLFQPIDHMEISAHARTFDELRKEQQERKRAETAQEVINSQIRYHSVNRSRLTKVVLEQDRQAKGQKQQEAQAKRSLYQKRRRYVDIVKVLFPPRVDPAKQQQLELQKRRLLHPSVPRVQRDSSTPDISRNRPLPKSASPTFFRRKKIRLTPLSSPEKGRREPVILDYLGDMRRKRDNYEHDGLEQALHTAWDLDLSDLSDSERTRVLRSKTSKMERKAKRTELLLSNVTLSNTHALDVNENLTDALLFSVKAKLNLIDPKSC